MSWQIRHQGSPQAVTGVSPETIAEGLRDGVWEPTDEVKGPNDSAWVAIENHPLFADMSADVEPQHRPHGEEATSIDMNALIDVCLVLLIFFILTTTYAAAVQKTVPMSSVKSDMKKGRVVSIDQVKKRMIRMEAYLDKAGKPVIRVENQTVEVLAPDGAIDPDKVRDALRPFVKNEDRKEILLNAREVSWGAVIAIQDGAKSAGVREIHHLKK